MRALARRTALLTLAALVACGKALPIIAGASEDGGAQSDGGICAAVLADTDVEAIRRRHADCTWSRDCTLVAATPYACEEFPPASVNASEAAAYTAELHAALDAYCACTNVHEIADGLLSEPVCWSSRGCGNAIPYGCDVTLDGDARGGGAKCDPEIGFSITDGKPVLFLAALDLDAGLGDPTVTLELEWPGPPRALIPPDGGWTGTYEGFDGGDVSFGMLTHAMGAIELVDGGLRVLRKMSATDPLKLGETHFHFQGDMVTSLDATLVDPSAPDAGAVHLHLEDALY